VSFNSKGSVGGLWTVGTDAGECYVYGSIMMDRLDKMTGTFNSTVLAQLNATASASTTGGSAMATLGSSSTGSAMGGVGATTMTRSGSGSAAIESGSGVSSGTTMVSDSS
jgi:hypothetical protein